METQDIVDYLSRAGNITECGVLYVVNYINNRISNSCLSKLSNEDLEIISLVLLNYNPEEIIGDDDIGGEFNNTAPNFITAAILDGVMNNDEIRKSFTLYKAIAKALYKKGLN